MSTFSLTTFARTQLPSGGKDRDLHRQKDRQRETVVARDQKRGLLSVAAASEKEPDTLSLCANDVWFASADNMKLVRHELDCDFIMPLKTNHFALKAKLYMNVLRSAFQTLDTLQPIRLAA